MSSSNRIPVEDFCSLLEEHGITVSGIERGRNHVLSNNQKKRPITSIYGYAQKLSKEICLKHIDKIRRLGEYPESMINQIKEELWRK